MIVNQFKVALLFYMVIVMQVQPEFKHDHNHEHHHKHPHDHDHDHHRRSEIRKASRIYNGVRTPPGRGKFMAVMVDSMRRTYCSAVIITGDMLLTAAHCLSNQSIAQIASTRILPNALPIPPYRNNPLGRHPLMKRIRNIWIHPRYNRNNLNSIYYDIAIVQIDPQPWPLGNQVDTALMPVRIRHFDLRRIKGYGFGLEVGEISPAYLNEVNFRYYGPETFCLRIFHYQISNNPDVIFCVTNRSPYRSLFPVVHSNAAPGDSGGGIFIKGSVRRFNRSTNRTIIKTGFVLAGITSKADKYSITSADSNLPYGVIAINVTTMMPWISSIVGVDFETYPFPMPNRIRINLS